MNEEAKPFTAEEIEQLEHQVNAEARFRPGRNQILRLIAAVRAKDAKLRLLAAMLKE